MNVQEYKGRFILTYADHFYTFSFRSREAAQRTADKIVKSGKHMGRYWFIYCMVKTRDLVVLRPTYRRAI